MIKYIKRIISAVLLVVISLFIVMNTQNQVDHNTLRIKGFYQEEQNSLDVILFGASEVFTGYSPAYAYNQFGFTSYSYAIDANYTMLIEDQIKETLAYQNPKCIIIETSCYYNPRQEEEKASSMATLRKWLDGVPLSMHKKEMIDKFVDSEKLSYYFPFIMYHGLMSNYYDAIVNVSQTFRGHSYLKGITTQTQKAPFDSIIDVSNDNNIKEMTEIDDKAFKDLLSFCKSLDCKVIFVRFPHRITNDTGYRDFMIQNYIEELVTQSGFDYINSDKKISDIGLSLYEDFYGDSHMNVNGQKKMTKYLGALLQKKYDLMPTDLSESNENRWKTSAKYTDLFYDYFHLHENENYSYYETHDLISELDRLK